MPAKNKEEGMPPMLAAYVHALLVQTGMTKTAKKFESEFDGELPDTDGSASLMELYEKHLAPAPAKDKKSKKSKRVEEEVEEEPVVVKKSTKSKKKAESDAEEGEEEKPKSKKAKKAEKAVEAEKEVERVEAAPAEPEENGSSKKGGKKDKVNVPFQRIKSDEVTYLKVKGGDAEAQRLLDNTFESKFADGTLREDYGAKASAILVQVRGKDFRHEKTKKKRGTYRGGPVDMASNSIKFADSDEDE